MTNDPYPHPPKSAWGAGPWQDEPDRKEWEHAGLPCLAVRHPVHGNWCGYAAVAPGHAWHGMDYGADPVDVSVHGGLTYAAKCHGLVCHVAKPGEPEDVWWFGFDCAHCCDFSPGMAALLRSVGSVRERDPSDAYCDLAYVTNEVNTLAEQLAAAAHG